MKDKYYTPSIEEFYVGFGYEYFEEAENEWIDKCEFRVRGKGIYFPTDGSDEVFRILLSNNHIRVKYLDRDDIESLGFEHTEGSDKFAWFKSGKWVMQFNNGHCHIHTGNEMLRHFSGYIKNKSELKKILKMIGYEGN